MVMAYPCLLTLWQIEDEIKLFVYDVNSWLVALVFRVIKLHSAHPETASFGPIRRSRPFAILDVSRAYAGLR